MPFQTFSAYLVRKTPDNAIVGGVQPVRMDDLPPGDVVVKVAYSSLNYKDALAATGNPGVARKLPHVPGIDAAGIVETSQSPEFQPGQSVIVTSFDLGAGQWGAWAEYIRVPASWVVPLPTGLTLRESMILGTAGFTAAMSLDTLLSHGVRPEQGEIVVTGATGGVGSWAIALLCKAGFRAVALSGKSEAADYLRRLGAAEIMRREAMDDHSPQPLLKGRWAGAIDTVGGNILATVLRATKAGGCVAACGLTAGVELPLTVYPFILRGVTLSGIDSATVPLQRRRALWSKLAGEWRTDLFDEILTREVGLAEVDSCVQKILSGQITGRVLVNVAGT